MKPLRCLSLVACLGLGWILPTLAAAPSPGNRLTYLDEDDPFYPHRDFPKLITPQWVGEPGVEAVVILAIDDMRETAKYETFLRPILNRLKQIDGRAPVSIMVNAVSPTNAQLQAWLKEGLSLEVHTLAHPCPCLAKGDFNAAANTYHGCVDLMSEVPGNKPVAFRMPCCDSMNSPSPRFFAEIFNRTSPAGRFLTIDSSVMCILTTNDPALPRDLVLDRDGREKFRKYLPTETNATTRVSLKNFSTTIEDYPYPYVIGKLCWEFPPLLPSDWEAFNLHGATNPVTLADWKSALDAVVLKQGVFPFIFHPHGWSSPQQFVEFIDYAVAKHGKKVKFLTFKEAQERLDRNLLAGNPLRAADGGDNAVRILDVNNDGFMDVVVGNLDVRKTRVWEAKTQSWMETGFPAPLSTRMSRLIERFEPTPPDSRADKPRVDEVGWLLQLQFGVFDSNGTASVLGSLTCEEWQLMRPIDSIYRIPFWQFAWRFESNQWTTAIARSFDFDPKATGATGRGIDVGIRCRDLDSDGRCEVIIHNERQSRVMSWVEYGTGANLDFYKHSLPKSVAYPDPRGSYTGPMSIRVTETHDRGLRFVDVNGDGYDDILFSNDKEFSLHLFIPKANPRLMWEVGWNDQVWVGKRGESDFDIPPIVRGGTNRNNGVWFKNGAMWIQNEDTAHLPDKVRKITFRELLTADQPPPLSPEQALASMRPRPGFKVELAAAEPLVLDPIAFDWGADGRLWVVDMFDYPLGRVDAAADTNQPTRAPHGEEVLTPPQGGRYAPGGRIKVLEDTDGDGRYDKATVFLDDVNFPSGLLPWRNGVLVAAAPEIFYAEDTDGDGKADKRTTLFTGFVEGNQQHRLNGFDYGLDNWIYGANGDSGGNIGSELRPDALRVSIRNRDFRFRPDTGEFEAVEGGTQYGRHRDDWGNWFGNNNPVWLWHYFLPERYVARNPHLTVKTTKQMLANYPNSGQLFPASRTRQRFNDHHHFNHVTSANSAMPYRDELFGPEFATSVFISDPVHNLVHREVLEPDGVSFTSHRAADETNREFLASTDVWFRPTMLKTGPDGALYVADMYRLVIEHPEWIPKWMQQRLDLRAGSDKGRIYRVFPEGATLRRIPNLAKLDTAGLVAALDSPNGWQRDTAQRLLVERKDKAAVGPLRKLVTESERPKTRVQALCTLDGLGALTLEDMQVVLRDRHAAVREHAARLTETLISTPTPAPGADSAWFALVADPELRVRYQAAFALGAPGLDQEKVGQALASLAVKDFGVAAMQTAILSSAPRYVEPLLRNIVSGETAGKAPPEMVEQLLGLAMALNNRRAIVAALEAIGGRPGVVSDTTFNALAGLLDGLERRGQTLRQFVAAVGPEAQALTKELERLIEAARSVAVNVITPVQDRRAAIRLLARTPEKRETDLQSLGQLLGAQNASAIQQAALAALARQKERAAADVLLATWKSQEPSVRTEVLNVLIGRIDWCRALVAAVQKGEIPAGQIGATYQQKLLNHSDATVRKRAAELFAAVSKDRQALLQQYAGVAKLTGDATKGMALYRQQCATCHRLRGEGSDVGPDLGTVGGKDVSALLVAMLDPNQAVDWRYAAYTAVTKDEREFSGVIAAETANSLTLRGPGGRDETFLRMDLREFKSSDLSLMPEGLEKALGPQEMADLIAALRGQPGR